jgi:hypothetical protein
MFYLCNLVPKFYDKRPAAVICKYKRALQEVEEKAQREGAEHKVRVLNFSTTFVRNISHSKKNWATYDQTYILVLMYCTRYSCQILMKTKFSRQIFEIYSNIKFHENPCNETSCFMRSGGHKWRSFAQFSERAWKLQKKKQPNWLTSAPSLTTLNKINFCWIDINLRKYFSNMLEPWN